ncbi:MAG: hypothetical protein QXU82_02135 [Candidatus Aenigmatarchaeota archaeon]
MKRLLAIAVLAVFVCGCTGQGGTTDYGENIVVLKDKNVLPNPVSAGGSFDISFVAQNVHATEDAKNVMIRLYDWGPAACVVNAIGGQSVAKANSYMLLNESRLPSGSERFIEIGGKAPSKAEIGGIASRCDFKYTVSYDSFAITTTDTSVISQSRLSALQRSGQTPTFTPTQTIGAGPIAISFEHATSLPVREGDELVFDVKISDRGIGNYVKIPANTLQITVPEEFVATQDGCGVEFYDAGVSNGKRTYTNSIELPLVKGSTSNYRCKFIAPAVVEERSFFITGRMDYTYVINDGISVDIIP